MQHLENTKDIKAFKQDPEKLGGHSFNKFYMDDLEKSSLVEPRPIDEEIFKPKRLNKLDSDTKYKNFLEKAE